MWRDYIQSLSLFGHGRLTPHQYMRNFAIARCAIFLIFPGIFIPVIILGVFLGVTNNTTLDVDGILSTFSLIVVIAVAVLSGAIDLFAASQRFHDMGLAGKRAFLLFIPLYNFYVIYQLCTTKGQEGMNEYGSPPTEMANKKAIEYFFAFSIVAVIVLNFFS
jgi:uncharacterized membrane protein YhaH (DUF805 family)